MKRQGNFIFLLIVVGLSLIAVWPLFLPEIFSSNDGGNHIVRIAQYAGAFKDGQYLVRWLPDLGGYGLPVFIFVPPLTYFTAMWFYLIGFSAISSFKIIMFLSITLSGITMFLFAREFFESRASLLAAVAYMFAPYRFVDVYVRGAMPESVAFIFIPLVFLGIKRINDRMQISSILLLSLSLAGLILTHNITALILFPFLLLYGLYLVMVKKKPRVIIHLTIAFLLSIGLTAFYWIPALLERELTMIGSPIGALSSNFRDHFVYPYQFISSFWGYGSSGRGPNDGISFQIGNIHILSIAMSLIAIPRIRDRNLRVAGIFFLIMFFISLFLMTEWSESVWEIFPILHFIQFPWRFLTITVFLSAFLTGAIVSIIQVKPGWAKTIGVGALTFPVIMLVPFFFLDQRNSIYSASQLLLFYAVIAVFLFVLWFTKGLHSSYITSITIATIILITMPFWNLAIQRVLSEQPRIMQISEEDLRPEMIRKMGLIGGAMFEFIPRTVHENPPKRPGNIHPPQQVIEVISGDVFIKNVERKSDRLTFDLKSLTQAEVLLNIFYYPGWTVLIDSERADIEIGEIGRIKFKVPEGIHRVYAEFRETNIRKIAKVTSLVSGLVFLAIIAMGRSKRVVPQ